MKNVSVFVTLLTLSTAMLVNGDAKAEEMGTVIGIDLGKSLTLFIRLTS